MDDPATSQVSERRSDVPLRRAILIDNIEMNWTEDECLGRGGPGWCAEKRALGIAFSVLTAAAIDGLEELIAADRPDP